MEARERSQERAQSPPDSPTLPIRSTQLQSLQVLTQIVATSGAEVALLRGMDEDLKMIEDCVGACERIFRTPVPLSYTYHTSRFLVFWLIFLPFTLYTEVGWVALPLAPIVTFLIFGVVRRAAEPRPAPPNNTI